MGLGSKRFTYGNNPAANTVDEVRFLVGDTNENRPLLDDREVEWAISEYPDPNLAAASLAEHLYGFFASKGDFKVGPINKSYSKVADLFKAKAEQLKAKACLSAGPSFPATKISTKNALANNLDLANPSFAIGLVDNPFAIQLNDEFRDLGRHGL